MLELAMESTEQNLVDPLLGSVERLAEIGDGSADVVFCINTIGYLEPPAQDNFFSESQRVLRRGGHLVVMTGNQLLDLFSLNSGTADFFQREFGVDVSELLQFGSQNRWQNAARFNPLSFATVLLDHGFSEIKQAYSQWHQVPPGLAALQARGDLALARRASRDHDVDPNSLPTGSRWQALFRCSMFASLSEKN